MVQKMGVAQEFANPVTEHDLAESWEIGLAYPANVAHALELICLDSRSQPQRYLDESLVPYGGE